MTALQLDGRDFEPSVPGKVVCIGRNYAAHAAELNNAIPESPILFIKPGSTVVLPTAAGGATAGSITECRLHSAYPETGGSHDQDNHFETELALLIGQPIGPADTDSASRLLAAIAGVGIALDLTKRELQSRLKTAGHPWELAKAFDGSCPVSYFHSLKSFGDAQPDELLNRLAFDMHYNDEKRQAAHASLMLTGCLPLLAYVVKHFSLQPGDLLLTGTPAGVGALAPAATLMTRLGLASSTEPDSEWQPLFTHEFNFAAV